MTTVDQTQRITPPRNAVSELERQVERGSMFTQAVFQKSFTRLSLVEAVVREMAEVLVERGIIADGDLPGAKAAYQETAAAPDDSGDIQRRCRGPRSLSGSTRPSRRIPSRSTAPPACRSARRCAAA